MGKLEKIAAVMDWWPSSIFYKSTFHINEFDDGSFFSSAGFFEKEFTKLGKFFVHYTPLLEILKLPYYILTIPVCMGMSAIWAIFRDLILPDRISKNL